MIGNSAVLFAAVSALCLLPTVNAVPVSERAFNAVNDGFAPLRTRSIASVLFRRNAAATMAKDSRRWLAKRQATNYTYPTFANSNATQYHVNTSSVPLLENLGLQDSWAGRIQLADDSSKAYFFWYFPSSQTGGSRTLTIWLNGGPGCSSLEGATTENGPFFIIPQGGEGAAVVNPDSWDTVSDMLYVEQPAGTGFSTGSDSDLTGEVPLADDFYSWLRAFYSVFPELAAKDLYITGESYAGFYIPYIATRILDASSTEKSSLPLNLKGLMINDGVYSSAVANTYAPMPGFGAAHQSILGLNSSTMKQLNDAMSKCGYQKVIDAVQFPPSGLIPHIDLESLPNSCDTADILWNAAQDANPCFNIYRITDKCPTQSTVVDTGSYFNRQDVQSALHASGNWSLCSDNYPFVNGQDNSPYSETKLPHLLENIPVMLWHGNLDSILIDVGDLVTIQNLTWNGQQGFSAPPNKTLTVNGIKAGEYNTERNLTYIHVFDAGHMIPQDQPAVALAVFQSFISTNGSLGNATFSAPTASYQPASVANVTSGAAYGSDPSATPQAKQGTSGASSIGTSSSLLVGAALAALVMLMQ